MDKKVFENHRHMNINGDDLGYEFYMRHITLSLRFATSEKLARYDITDQQGRLLGIIHEAKKDNIKISRKILQDFMHLSGPSVTSLLNGLEKNEFIVRTSSEDDPRAIDIEITEKGTNLINDMYTIFANAEEKIVEGMSGEEKEIFKRLLKQAYKNVSGLEV